MLHPNYKLTWKREPSNQHDPNAISLWAESNQVGHIAKEIAAELAPMLDRGDIDLDVIVTAVTGGFDNKTNGINIELHITYKNMKHLSQPEATFMLAPAEDELRYF